MAHQAAIIVCTGQSDTQLLGLSLGERTLLALSYGGVDRVVFVGEGARPACARASLRVVEWTDIEDEPGVFVVPDDCVFDRKLLSNPTEIPEGGAIKWLDVATAQKQAEDPHSLLESLGQGAGGEGAGFALRVANKASWKKAHKSLLLSLRKPIDGLVSRHLNRYISTFITSYLVRTGIPPNFFTVFFLGIGLAAAWFVSLGEPWWALVVGAFLFQSQSILDGCDGEIARLTYRFSHIGQWLDSIGDDITNYAFCLGLAIGQAKATGQDWILVMGLATLGAQIIASVVLYRRLIIMKTGDLLAIPNLLVDESDGGEDSFFSKLALLFKRDSFVFIIAVITAAQMPVVAFLAYSLGTFPTVFCIVLNDRKIAKLPPEQHAR